MLGYDHGTTPSGSSVFQRGRICLEQKLSGTSSGDSLSWHLVRVVEMWN